MTTKESISVVGHQDYLGLPTKKGCNMNRNIAVMAALTLTAIAAFGQNKNEPTTARTKIEAFERQAGSVIIRGFSHLGAVPGTFGGSVSVETREFTNATTGKKEYGITVEVKESGRLEREDRSYVDYDEIEGLLKGIEYISKINKSVTPMDEFQADYRTKGDLMISTFSSSGTIDAAVQSGRIGGADVIINMPNLQKLHDLIMQAKAKIDATRATT